MSIEKKPLVNDLYTADPSAHVFNGKIYIYPSHDEDIDVESNDNGDQYDMKDYHVYEMKDTETYPRDCGCVFTLKDVKWASKQLWAPDCEEKDGKYYFYFPARDKTGMFRVGVAVGDKPEGPFTPEDDYIQGTYSIDPCCFKDTDGKYYLTMGGLWGGQLDQYRNNKWSADNKEPKDKEPACTPKIALLKDNMKELAEELRDLVIVDEFGQPLTGGDDVRRYFEDPWLFKKGDTYYFTYSTGTSHLLCYATSKNVYGPYTYGGCILSPVLGWTTHHSILEFNGKWYLFYHDCERSKGINQKRNVKFRELTFKPDGKIQTMDGFDR
ncbi:glycoside hydrolase family 43 protein [Treponema bryantii]|uniref:glycoside hydrolase family 43 protein n=1 Tax=Treponema bryantii TaxID=163 RepID=UPI0003B74C1F|nr:glycoside hydrolase family 43 protein [Treponema bryantii]